MFNLLENTYKNIQGIAVTPDSLIGLAIQNDQGIELKRLQRNQLENAKGIQPEEKIRFKEILGKYNTEGDSVTLVSFLLSLFASSIVILGEIREKPCEKFGLEQYKKSRSTVSCSGTGKDLAIFLYSLKNSPKKDEAEKFNQIKSNFTKLLDGKTDFDVSERVE